MCNSTLNEVMCHATMHCFCLDQARIGHSQPASRQKRSNRVYLLYKGTFPKHFFARVLVKNWLLLIWYYYPTGDISCFQELPRPLSGKSAKQHVNFPGVGFCGVVTLTTDHQLRSLGKMSNLTYIKILIDTFFSEKLQLQFLCPALYSYIIIFKRNLIFQNLKLRLFKEDQFLLRYPIPLSRCSRAGSLSPLSSTIVLYPHSLPVLGISLFTRKCVFCPLQKFLKSC